MMDFLKNILTRTVIVCLATVYYPFAGYAQSQPYDEDWRWVQFTTESGLPSNHIYHLVETKDGTVWVGTSNGVAWYDGIIWRSIDSSKGLPLGGVAALYADNQDSMMVVTYSNLYKGSKSGFRLISSDSVETAIPFENNKILILSNQSLFIYHDGKINPYMPLNNITRKSTVKLWRTDSDRAWIQTNKSLYCWDGEQWIQKITSKGGQLIVNCIAESKNGTGLVSISTTHILGGLWEWYDFKDPKLNAKESGDYLKILTSCSNEIVLSLYHSGEIHIRNKQKWTSFFSISAHIQNVNFIKFSQNADLWVGSQNGLFIYRQSLSYWKYEKKSELGPIKRINSILRATDSTLWIGTANGLEIRRPNHPIQILNKIQKTKLYNITGIEEDNQRSIWISSGSSFGGAFELGENNKWVHHVIFDKSNDVTVHKIVKDRHDRLWFMTIGRINPNLSSDLPGAFVYSGNKFLPIGTKDGLLSGRVYCFAEGLRNELWFGTYGGLSRLILNSPFAINSGKWKHWTKKDGIRGNHIFSVAVDNDNRLWFADRYFGLGYIDDLDSIRYLTVEDGLIDNQIWDIKVDRTNKVWVSSLKGLGSFYQGLLMTYDYNSGLIQPRIWPILLGEDKIIVGTAGSGTAILDLNRTIQPSPKIFLEESGSQESSAFLRWKALAYWGQPSPKEVLTRYRVGEGQWSIWSNQHDVSIRNIDPGTYSYQVQAKGLFGDFDLEGATGAFTIPLPYYRHPLTIISSILLVVIVVSVTLTLVNRKKRRNQVLIESEEKFRAVAEATASAIFIYQNARFQYFNPVMTNLVGYTNEELSANSLWKLIKPAQVRSVRPAGSARDLSWLVPGHYEFTVDTKDGIERSIDLTIGEVEYRGKPAKLGTAFDITERKKSEHTIIIYQDQLRTLASALSMAEEKERRRLASLLHDRIGQTLAYCKIKLGAFQAAPNPNSSMAEIKEIRNLIDQSIVDTRSLTSELSPPVLYELGLLKAVEWLAEEMNRKYNIHFTVHRDADSNLLDEESEIILYHAIRELMMNIIKHAHVGTAHIKFKRSERYFFTHTEDQGTGFDVTNNGSSLNGNNGFGLFSIRERLSHIGGSMEIMSSPGNGTKVILTVPFTRITKKKGHNAVD